jgi:membrane-associated phospholipid phosphatase
MVGLWVLAALLVGALGLSGFAAWWVVGHPERIRAGLTWLAERPVAHWMRSRYPRQWQFLGRRFAPGEAAGLTLTLGVVSVLVLGVGFRQVLDGVQESDGIAVADRPVLGFFATHRQPWSTTAAELISNLGSPLGVAVTGLVVGLLLAWWRHSWLPLLVIVLGGAGIAAINTTIKHVVGRNRPPQVTAVLGEHGFSFPSGHTTGTTVVWMLLAWMVNRWVISLRVGRVLVWTVTLLLIVTVGATRIYLGVHFLSDVLAGWALGAAWAVTIALVTRVWEQAPNRSPRRAYARSA